MRAPATSAVVRLVLGPRLRPEAVYAALLADRDYAFWLRRGTKEVMGCADETPGSILRDPLTQLRLAGAPDRESEQAADPGHGPVPLPLPVPGWFGWLGYEDGVRGIENAPTPAGAAGGSVMMRCSRLIVVDAGSGEVELVWLGGDAGAQEWARGVASRIAGEKTPDERMPRPAPPSTQPAVPELQPRWRHSDEAYLDLIRQCLDAIRRGDAYQLCLTNQATIAAHVDPLRLHAALRALSPAPESAMIRAGDISLVSSSPERFLTIDRAGTIATHPIKGTRPRGTDADSDRALAEELRLDPKERAENVMIVDLMRNDLSRVCELGTVTVTRLFEVESYPHVHQLVSAIAGRLRPDVTVMDAVRACFPAGSMTGAPKHAAVTILRELENGPRGIYSGCYGSIGFDGTAHLSIAIRSAVVGPDTVTIGAGGGITAASDPERELAEVKLKASALIAAVRGPTSGRPRAS